MNEKTCSKCGNIYPATKEYFSAVKHGKFGLRGECKTCQHTYNNAYNRAHRGQCNAANRRWYTSSKGKEWYHQYLSQRREKISARHKKYYLQHRQEILARCKERYRRRKVATH